MEQVLTKALAFVAVIALGYFLKKRGFFKPHDYELIAKIFADDCLGIYIDALSDECGKDFLRI